MSVVQERGVRAKLGHVTDFLHQTGLHTEIHSRTLNGELKLSRDQPSSKQCGLWNATIPVGEGVALKIKIHAAPNLQVAPRPQCP